jgi:hypothetical protein
VHCGQATLLRCADSAVALVPAPAAAQVLSSQLSGLAAAIALHPAKVRRLARYHRAWREEVERRQQDEFRGTWDRAEGR